MSARLKIEERYTNADDIIYYVMYESTTLAGTDQVLQHQIKGLVESAHITLHPDGTVNFNVKRSRQFLENAVRTNLAGYSPEPSKTLRSFLDKVRNKV